MKIQLAWLASAIVVTGCAALPAAEPPQLDLSASWHATLPHQGKTADLLAWWGSFKDPALTALMTLAEANSPTLASSVAAIDKARATEASARAGLFPSLTGSGSIERSGTNGSEESKVAASNTTSGGLDASWEIDLFGKTRAQVSADRARVEEQVADWHDARVSLAAEIADDYVQYRACRLLEQTYREELKSQQETISATQTAATSGFTSGSDLALARASAASSSSTLTSQQAECEVLVKTLTELAATDETEVRKILGTQTGRIPTPPHIKVDSVPADLLRQRPDVAGLEREMAATLYEVGYAKADLYPSLSLSGSLTISHSTLTGNAVPWSFGPSLSIPLFDGGSRRAAVNSAEAAYRSAVASYKSGVLTAVDDVETAMVRVDSTTRRIGDSASAASNYRTYFKAIDDNWRAGGTSLLDREEARRSALSAEITLIEVRRDAVRYWIALYKALGGGWQKSPATLAPPPSASQGTSQ